MKQIRSCITFKSEEGSQVVMLKEEKLAYSENVKEILKVLG